MLKNTIVVSACVLSLSGCSFFGKPNVSCDETSTKDLVKQIFSKKVEELLKDPKITASHSTILEYIAASVNDVRTDSFDEKINKYTCKANLSISLPLNAMGGFSEYGKNFIDKQGLTITANGIQGPIEYTSQSADGGKNHYVEMTGHLPVAEIIVGVAVGGAFNNIAQKSSKPDTSENVIQPPVAAPSMSYEPLIVSNNGDAIGDTFTVSPLESGSAINYLSRAGITNVLESVVEDPEGTGYVTIEKAYKFGEKYILIISTGQNGNSCPATTYVFAYDTKTESVTGKKEIDGCSENIESFSDGNKLVVKKEGKTSTFYNGDIK